MKEPINILLVEDDADDIELLKKALEDNRVSYNMHAITRGDWVAAYMRSCNLLPQVIVMDLNMPRVHGKEILVAFKASERFSAIPLVVLTTSGSREDMDFTESLGADGFLTKPTTLEGFNAAVQTIVSLARNPIDGTIANAR